MSAMLLAGQLASAGLKYGVDQYNKSKMPKFAKSNLGQYYAKIKSQGVLSPKGITARTNQFASELNRNKDDAKSVYQGQLMKRFGGTGSIAGVRGMNEMDLKAGRSVADYKAMMTDINERSKTQAGLKLAEGKYQDKMARYQMDKDARSNLINSVTGAVTGSLSSRDAMMKDPSIQQVYDSLNINRDDPSSTDVSPLINKLTKDGKTQDEIMAYLQAVGLLDIE